MSEIDSNPDSNEDQQPKTEITPEVQELINKAVADSVQKLKGSLDNLDAGKKAAEAALAAANKKIHEQEVAALEAAGKLSEAAELKAKELADQLANANSKIVSLTRDNALRSALSGLDFRSPKTSSVAFNDIVSGLTQNGEGNWVDATGRSITDIVTAYGANEENAFLFKPKPSSGTGTPPISGVPPKDAPTSVFEMKQADVIARNRQKLQGT